MVVFVIILLRPLSVWMVVLGSGSTPTKLVFLVYSSHGGAGGTKYSQTHSCNLCGYETTVRRLDLYVQVRTS
jgi:hypothetical protein